MGGGWKLKRITTTTTAKNNFYVEEEKKNITEMENKAGGRIKYILIPTWYSTQIDSNDD